jgi:hypothetical protein
MNVAVSATKPIKVLALSPLMAWTTRVRTNELPTLFAPEGFRAGQSEYALTSILCTSVHEQVKIDGLE